MIEVTSDNFKEVLPVVKNQIEKATFISFDGEFSGLNSDSESLFDSMDERYQILQTSLPNYLILQLGISVHRFDRESNAFTSDTYCFYLMPAALPNCRDGFQFHLHALKFLCEVGLDWKSALGRGVTYTSGPEEEEVKRLLERDQLISAILNSLWQDQLDACKQLISKVADWESLGKSDELDLPLPNSSDVEFIFYLSREIQYRFPNLWVSYTASKSLKITKVSEISRSTLVAAETHDSLISDYFRGFSHVFWALVNAKKPLVGHNCLKDLAMMYQQFVGPLPPTYKKFKIAVHELFPAVYDTKNLSYNLRDSFPTTIEYDVPNLQQLYSFFSDGPGNAMAMYPPGFKLMAGSFHNAAFDAFCTGFCFARMAYYFTICGPNRKLNRPLSPLPWISLVSSLNPHKNCINVIRCQVAHINLAGNDPPPSRPPPLLVSSNQRIDFIQLRNLICRFGSVDIRSVSHQSALLAVPNRSTARQVTDTLRQHKYLVSETRSGQTLGRGVILFGLAALVLIYCRLKR